MQKIEKGLGASGEQLEKLIKERIRTIEDYPKKGVTFRDLTPLFRDRRAFNACIAALADRIGDKADVIVGIEARGFIVGAAVASRMELGFVPIRKESKLPWDKIKREYILEYGTGKLEIHKDAIAKGERVAIVDDLLATGGSSHAAVELVEELGGRIDAIAFIVELSQLNGREKLKGYNVFSLAKY